MIEPGSSIRRGRVVAFTGVLALGVVLATTDVTSMAVGVGVAMAVPRSVLDSRSLDAPAPGGADVWLVVGSDLRTTDVASAAAEHSGARADTLLLCVIRDSVPPAVVALPRDVRVDSPPYGAQRLGGLLDYGPAAVIQGVRAVTGLPVHHYVEVRMEAVVAAVDALGGMAMTIPARSRDLMTGLSLDAGEQELDGSQVLALVRSRQLEEERDGAWVAVGGDDEGRLERELAVLSAFVDTADSMRTALRVPGLATATAPFLSVDRSTGPTDIARLVSAFSGGRRTTAVLPTERVREYEELLSPFAPAHLGGAPQRRLTNPQALALLAELAAP